MKLIETAWNDYRTKVLPLGASRIQITECQKAFYAGAGELLSSLLRVFGPGVEPTESDIAMLQGVADELEHFVEGQIKLESIPTCASGGPCDAPGGCANHESSDSKEME